jgi:hypothetical protein
MQGKYAVPPSPALPQVIECDEVRSNKPIHLDLSIPDEDFYHATNDHLHGQFPVPHFWVPPRQPNSIRR